MFPSLHCASPLSWKRRAPPLPGSKSSSSGSTSSSNSSTTEDYRCVAVGISGIVAPPQLLRWLPLLIGVAEKTKRPPPPWVASEKMNST
ncbi:hypothetical protein Drorol1_Dr00022123 [Drosera rotundifolia]